jgi:hypothetical protein
VCDEAHRLKNPKTKVYKTLAKLNAKMRLMVTGTPIQVAPRAAWGGAAPATLSVVSAR